MEILETGLESLAKPTVLEVLKAAREKIKDKVNWTQEAYARNASDIACDELSDEACRLCAMGALYRALYRDVYGQKNNHHIVNTPLFIEACNAIGEACRKIVSTVYYSIVIANDRQIDGIDNHAQVIAIYDEAISMLEMPSLSESSEVDQSTS